MSWGRCQLGRQRVLLREDLGWDEHDGVMRVSAMQSDPRQWDLLCVDVT